MLGMWIEGALKKVPMEEFWLWMKTRPSLLPVNVIHQQKLIFLILNLILAIFLFIVLHRPSLQCLYHQTSACTHVVLLVSFAIGTKGQEILIERLLYR